MDYQIFCSLFFTSAHLPVAYVTEHTIRETYGIPAALSPFPNMLSALPGCPCFPHITSHESGYYGIIRLEEKKDAFLFLGPAFTTRITPEVIDEYRKENAIPHGRKDEVFQLLSMLPSYTYSRFLNTVIFLEYLLNHRCLNLTTDFHMEGAPNEAVAASQVEASYSTRDLGYVHGTYHLEQQILNLIRTGNKSGLQTLLLQTVGSRVLNEGPVAQTPLRQAKNVFIAMVALAGKQAAIPGGLDIEQTYQLIDQYSQECERLQDVESVANLQYSMLLDFASRVSLVQIPAEISPEIYICIQFINSHINEPISLQDVADFIHRSRAYTAAHFKEELGFNIGEYITHARIQEAKSLLRYTNKSLSDISNYLCYSSQSYFQNVFKKVVGITPLEYRQRARH